MDKGVISDLQYDTELVDLSGLGGNTYIQEKYCGRGPAGDMICIIADESLFGQKIIYIKLIKGNFGEKPVTFE